MSAADEVHSRLRERASATTAAPALEPMRLPMTRYVDPNFYRVERGEMFGRAWLLTCRVDEIASPGLYLTWEHLNVPLLIVHAVDGVVRCFYNSCRHRGAPVVRAARGRNRALRCQYHSWTYDTSGKLVSVPDERDFVDLQREERGLVPVACEIAGGTVFVNEAPRMDVRSWLVPLGREVTNVDFSSLRTLSKHSITIPVNWKRVMSALLTLPIVPPRPGLPPLITTEPDVTSLPGANVRIVAPFDEASAAACGLDDPLAWSMLEDEGLPTLPGIDPMLSSTVSTFALFPNTLYTFTPSGVLNMTLWPSDERTTLVEAVWIAPGWGEEDSPIDTPAWQQRIKWIETLLADVAASLDGAQAEMEDLHRRGLPLEEDSEVFRRWNRTLNSRLQLVLPPKYFDPSEQLEIR